MKKNLVIISYSVLLIILISTFSSLIPFVVKADQCVPSYLQKGDILFCECKNPIHSIIGWDHVSIYIGNNKFIEAVPKKGIWITNLSIYNKWAKDIIYGYVKSATAIQRQKAVNFVYDQLGKSYQYRNLLDPPLFNLLKDADPDSNEWYCSELLWAAYYHHDIDIDYNKDNFPQIVTPSEIQWDEDIEMYPGEPPYPPKKPLGRSTVFRILKCFYVASTSDPENNDLYYQWDWGNYIGPWYLVSRKSGDLEVRTHRWFNQGIYNIRIRAKDIWGNIGKWSDPLTVTVI